jgi:hypothetical protein
MRKVRKHQLRHDLEQFRYLLNRDRLPRTLTESATAAYEDVLSQFSDAAETDMLMLSWSQWETLGQYFNRALYLSDVSRAKGGCLNLTVNFTEVEAAYSTTRSDPHLVIVEALDKLIARQPSSMTLINIPSILGPT